jgi:AraC-like DNA-binding protein
MTTFINHQTIESINEKQLRNIVTIDCTEPLIVSQLVHFLLSEQIPFTMKAEALATQRPQTNSSFENLPKMAPKYPKKEKKKKQEKEILSAVYQKYIVECTDQVPPTMVEIAEEFGIEILKLKKLFKEEYGQPFYQLHMAKKMAYAASLLAAGHTANAVSKLIGYAHPIKFNKIFQKYHGTTPFKYKKEHYK